MLGLTISTLMQRLSSWTKLGDEAQRVGYGDRVLLRSFEHNRHDPRPLTIPKSVQQYVLE
jgi:hypothetical protein